MKKNQKIKIEKEEAVNQKCPEASHSYLLIWQDGGKTVMFCTQCGHIIQVKHD